MQLTRELQLVRETLEGTIEPRIATAVLFEALEHGDALPSDGAKLLELVRGRLREGLAERLGADRADEVIVSLEERLVSLAGVGAFDIAVHVEEMATAKMATVEHPVGVLVASASERCAQQLLAALGTRRVYPFTVAREDDFRRAALSARPLIAIVDASRPPAIGAALLVSALCQLPDRTLPVIWASETSFGRDLRARMEASERAFVHLDRSHGVDPLLDLVLVRFTGA